MKTMNVAKINLIILISRKHKKIDNFLKIGLRQILFVCLYPVNVKTAEPIGPKFFVGHHMTTGKVYE